MHGEGGLWEWVVWRTGYSAAFLYFFDYIRHFLPLSELHLGEFCLLYQMGGSMWI